MARLGPLPSAPGCLKGRFVYGTATSTNVNVFHMQWSGTAPDGAALAAIATQLNTLWNTSLGKLVQNSAQLTVTEVTDLSSPTGAIVTNTTSQNGSAGTGIVAPLSACICLSFPTPLRFRGGHCRMYIGALLSSAVGTDGKTLASATLTAARTNALAFLNGVNGIASGSTTVKLIMLSYYEHDANHQPIYHPGGPKPYLVSGTNVHSRLDTQRRRLGKEFG